MDLKSLYFENDPKLFNILTTETPKAQNKSAQINTPLDKSFVNCEGYLWCITQVSFLGLLTLYWQFAFEDS